MPGLVADAPDRVTDSHREASPPRSSPHATDSVALGQLEGTRITRKGDPSSFHPHLKWWLQKDNVLQGHPLHPFQMHQEGWGAHLMNTLQGEPCPFQKQVTHKLSGTKAVFWP